MRETTRQAELNRMRVKLRQQQQQRQSERGPFYWVDGYSKRKGARTMYGWWRTPQEAHQWAFTYTNGIYKVYDLPTHNRAEATAMMKAKGTPDGREFDLDNAIERVRHKGKDIGIEERNND